MDKQPKPNTRFDLDHTILQVEQKIEQQQVELYKELTTRLQMHSRQKLKHYKRILESDKQKPNAQAKSFINKYLKHVFLLEYIFGTTEAKPSLINLLKKLDKITFADLNAVTTEIEATEFYDIKYWSEIVDLTSRVFAIKPSVEDFKKTESILVRLWDYVYEGEEMIAKNEFKTRWLITYTEILRTANLLLRVFDQFISQERKQSLLKSIRNTISNADLISKQILTQAFLMLIFLNPQEPRPSQNGDRKLCLIHFYHAQNIVLGKANLKELIELISCLTQTEEKVQLLPILEQSFAQHYTKYDKPFRDNCFDTVINLFEVGRSVYHYLQHIVQIIIENQDAWNMEGNYLRKFFIATMVLKILPTNSVLELWPTIMQDVIVHSGIMNVPFAIECGKILLQKRYDECGKNFDEWSKFWMPIYKEKLLKSNEKSSIRSLVEYLNPVLIKICPQPILLEYLISQYDVEPHPNLELGIISLIRCYKQLGHIVVDNDNEVFKHLSDEKIVFEYRIVRNFLLSNDEMVALQALELISCSNKPSELVKPMEMNLCLEFIKHSLKTSLPEYRKNYLAVIKKLFNRLRTIYDNQLLPESKSKSKKLSDKEYFPQFKRFLHSLIQTCFTNVFPDAIFEVIDPSLQILSLVLIFFGPQKFELKKGFEFMPTNILEQTSFFDYHNFENVLSCLQSSYESVRKLSHHILNSFVKLNCDELLLSLWEKSLQNTNKLAIKSYEYASRVLTLIGTVYPNVLNLKPKYQNTRLNVLDYFLSLMKERYGIFKEQFAKQGGSYYKNLVHGILTVISYSLDSLNDSFKKSGSEQQNVNRKEFQEFFSQLFVELINIMNFSVEISSSNVSTVVLDTLNQKSQTDKKFKVDCRGHFLNESEDKELKWQASSNTENPNSSTSVGSLLESTALISSMEDDEDGIQNTLVVSFYLLTREAGLVFQSVAGLLVNERTSELLPIDGMKKLINTFFFALINLKHMGSVDRISKGLGKMAHVIYDHDSKELSEVPEVLLNKLIEHLREGSFTNILRRSAGVPYAFTCLLKSEALKRTKLIEKTMGALLELSTSEEKNQIELRVHSLNILKKLFQDSDLKGDLQPYVSDAFVLSIRGFSSEQWGVRNSSLMLFSTLANRTVGIKPTYNLLEFFHRCPSLLEFVQNELNTFTEESLNVMYPPLYPIVLLFSRLLPFDLREKSRLTLDGSVKQIRKEQLLGLLPLLDKSGINNNYMGRVMTAKAILPFMQIDQIVEYCVEGVLKLDQYFHKDNNLLHYELTKYNHLLTSYVNICNSSLRSIKASDKVLHNFLEFVISNCYTIPNLQCAVVEEGFIKFIHFFLDNFGAEMQSKFAQKFKAACDSSLKITNHIFEQYIYSTQNFLIPGDMGHSILRKEALNLHFDVLLKQSGRTQLFNEQVIRFSHLITDRLKNNSDFFQVSDNEVCEYFLQKIIESMNQLKEKGGNSDLAITLSRMLQCMPLDNISSDLILIKVLELREVCCFKSESSEQQIAGLIKMQKVSNNHFLRIAIFKYLVYTKVNQTQIIELLKNFSDPESLEEMRQCCVEYLEEQPTYNQKHDVVYVRLLEDEEYEIRKLTAKSYARLHPGLYCYNESYLKSIILKQIGLQDLEFILNNNSDFPIKRKNNQEERIFSYDKPNKYREDIDTLITILSTNDKLFENPKEVSEVFKRTLNEKEFNRETAVRYRQEILLRTEYEFQVIVRSMVALFGELQSHKMLKQACDTQGHLRRLLARLISKEKK